MVRATKERVKVRLGGDYPGSWDDAKVTALCASADYFLDGLTYPDVLSATADVVIEVAVEIVQLMIRQADHLQHSSGSTSLGERSYGAVGIRLPTELLTRIKNLRTDPTYLGMAVAGMVKD